MALLFDWPADDVRNGPQALADSLDFSDSLATCTSFRSAHGPSRTSTVFSVLTEGGNELEASIGEGEETLQFEWDGEGDEEAFGSDAGGPAWPEEADTYDTRDGFDATPILNDELSSLEADPLDLARFPPPPASLDAVAPVDKLEAQPFTSQQSTQLFTEAPTGLAAVIEDLKRDFDGAFPSTSLEETQPFSPSPKRFRSRSPSLPPPRLDALSRARFELPPPIRPHSPTQAEMDAFFGFVHPLASRLQAEETLRIGPAEAVGDARMEVGGSQSVQEAATPVAAPPLQRAAAPNGPQNSVDGSGEAQKAPAPDEAYFQLAPIPTASSTGVPLSLEERRLAIISSLEQLALSVLSQVVDNVAPPASRPVDSSQAPARPPWKQVRVVLAKRGGSKISSSSRQTIRFPRKYGQGKQVRLGGKELACFLRLVELVLDGLRNEQVSTKRDLYYRDVALFGKQYILDSLIEDLAATLDVRRSELNVIAAAKGLVAGAIKLVVKDGTEQNGREQSLLIPTMQTLKSVEADAAEWVLVIEKEAVFQTLATSTLLDDGDLGNGIILTGKGYPDIATRDLLKLLADSYPALPLFALVDSDPHGLDILSTYRFGSASLSHDSANLAVPRLEWLGVRGGEWDSLGIDRDELLPLSLHDRRKALAMLRREGLPDEWRRELEYSLHLGRKAEIQILASSSSPSQHAIQTQSLFSSSDSTAAAAPSRIVDYIKGKLRLALAARTEGTQHA